MEDILREKLLIPEGFWSHIWLNSAIMSTQWAAFNVEYISVFK
jgi:hypothetical protein